MKVRIIVTPKEAVLDPQGKTVEKALHRMGYTETQHVRIGKYIEMDVENSDRERTATRVDDMCKKLLSNPVIENVRYEFAD